MKVENAWVVEILNLPSVTVSKEDIKVKWEQLKDISIETSYLEISLLRGGGYKAKNELRFVELMNGVEISCLKLKGCERDFMFEDFILFG